MARSGSDQLIKSEKLAYKEALFDAKFTIPAQQTTPLETPIGLTLNKASLVASIAASTPVVKGDHTDCVLKGVWSQLWEKQIQRCNYTVLYY